MPIDWFTHPDDAGYVHVDHYSRVPKGQLDPPSVVIGRVLGQFNRGLVFGLGLGVALRLLRVSR